MISLYDEIWYSDDENEELGKTSCNNEDEDMGATCSEDEDKDDMNRPSDNKEEIGLTQVRQPTDILENEVWNFEDEGEDVGKIPPMMKIKIWETHLPMMKIKMT